MTEVVTLKYWYDFGITEPKLETVEKQALVIAPNTFVTANGECISIEVIVSEIDFESLIGLSVAEMFRRLAAMCTKKA